jgi:hypothetical protein
VLRSPDGHRGGPLGGGADLVRAVRDHLGARPALTVVGVKPLAAVQDPGQHYRVLERLAPTCAP